LTWFQAEVRRKIHVLIGPGHELNGWGGMKEKLSPITGLIREMYGVIIHCDRKLKAGFWRKFVTLVWDWWRALECLSGVAKGTVGK
jgi:hypothetical protein